MNPIYKMRIYVNDRLRAGRAYHKKVMAGAVWMLLPSI